MKNNKSKTRNRNWFLVVIASVLIVIGIIIAVSAILNIGTLGWGGVFLALAGLSTSSLATTAIITNNSSWILLDLLLPM